MNLKAVKNAFACKGKYPVKMTKVEADTSYEVFFIEINYYLKTQNALHQQYKRFRKNLFRSKLQNVLCKNDFNNMGYSKILRIFLQILCKCVPLKKYHLRETHAKFYD